MKDWTLMTREEKEMTQLGPARIRVGYFDPDSPARRTYFEQEAPEGWAVRAAKMRGKTMYLMTTSFDKDDDGKDVDGKLIHIFSDASRPMVVIDYENHYGERIDVERMTLAEYLNQEEG
jgi:hypothetical protein|tara:strand:- start:1109 stop:1465 length:357 start_codon:yes stop_codon:yes gene_type:complete